MAVSGHNKRIFHTSVPSVVFLTGVRVANFHGPRRGPVRAKFFAHTSPNMRSGGRGKKWPASRAILKSPTK